MTNREIILELEEVMFKNDMTQEQLAKKLRVSFQTVNRWFNEHTEPNRRNWYKIEKYLKTNRD